MVRIPTKYPPGSSRRFNICLKECSVVQLHKGDSEDPSRVQQTLNHMGDDMKAFLTAILFVSAISVFSQTTDQPSKYLMEDFQDDMLLIHTKFEDPEAPHLDFRRWKATRGGMGSTQPDPNRHEARKFQSQHGNGTVVGFRDR